MDQPKIPTLKDSQKPQVKVRGLGAGLSFFDRIKQFNKKDLAFILAGLGTLFMAPLAEHFMMSPDNGDASLSPGFGSGKGAGPGIFGAEDRTSDGSGTAVGSPVGGSDVITPLNVRDPSSLIMGPGSSSQPPTNSSASVAPSVSAPGRSDQDVRDALAGAASHAASAAVKKSLLPVPKIGLSGSSLRGLGVATGNSSATAGGGPSMQGLGLGSHGNVANNMAGVKGGGNIASVGPRGLTTGADALTALKAAGDKAGGMFDRAAGSAQGNLNAAANEAIPSGGGPSAGGGSGPGGGGPGDKPGNGGGPKDSKSGGESLAYELMKQNLQKQLELYWKEQEAMDPTLELYKMRNSMAEAVAGAVGTNIGGMASALMNGVVCQSKFMSANMPACMGLGQGTLSCIQINVSGGASTVSGAPVLIQNYGGTQLGTCQQSQQSTGGNMTTTAASAYGFPQGINGPAGMSGGMVIGTCNGMQPGAPYYYCTGTTGPSSPTTNSASGSPAVNNLPGVCTTVGQLASSSSSGGGVSAAALSNGQNGAANWLKKSKSQMANWATARQELTGNTIPAGTTGSCGEAPIDSTKDVPYQQNQVAIQISNAMVALTGGQTGSSNVINMTADQGKGGLATAVTDIIAAQKAFTYAAGGISDATSNLSGSGIAGYTGNDCGDGCSGIAKNGNAAKTDLSTMLTSANTLQSDLQKILQQAQVAVGQAQSTVDAQLPTDPTTITAAPPTVQQVLQANSYADNLTKALVASKSSLTPPAIKPAVSNGGPDPAGQAVDGAVQKAYTDIATACSGIGYSKDCLTPPQQGVATPQTPTTQAMLDSVAADVNGARNTQFSAAMSISAAAGKDTTAGPSQTASH